MVYQEEQVCMIALDSVKHLLYTLGKAFLPQSFNVSAFNYTET